MTLGDEKKVANIDHIVVPSPVMGKVLETSLTLLMPTDVKQLVIEEMIKAGIRLNDKTAGYSISQIRATLHMLFGSNGAELLVDIMRNILNKTRQFEGHH